MSSIPLMQGVDAGAVFEAGCFTLRSHHLALWHDAVQCSSLLGINPGIACLIAFRGAGVSISELMGLLRAEPGRVLFGEIEFTFDEPFVVGSHYRVQVAITAIERKQGRRYALFDRVTLEYRILASDGHPAATVGQQWVVVRSA